MRHTPNGSIPTTSSVQLLLAYVADLELEVDRLRRQGQFVLDEARQALVRIRSFCQEESRGGNVFSALGEIDKIAGELASVLRDVKELPGYHPAHDQVIAIAVRPLIEQVFLLQQRMMGAPEVVLRLNLETDCVEWFPARLRHILDNLLANSLKYRDATKTEQWVQVGLRASPEAYELRVADNGLGLPPGAHNQAFDLFHRAAPARAAGLGVGLAIVKMLVEQSGGSLKVDSGAGQGTVAVAVVPRYDLDDFLA